MKNIFLSVAAFLLLVLAGCDKDDNPSTINPTSVSNTLITGSWRVTYYFDTDHDETSNFTGYNFTFSANGAVSAVNDILSRQGTWITETDDSKTKLVLHFSTPAEFEEISEDWEVTERTDARVKLQHISGGNGGTDYLTFEKN